MFCMLLLSKFYKIYMIVKKETLTKRTVDERKLAYLSGLQRITRSLITSINIDNDNAKWFDGLMAQST